MARIAGAMLAAVAGLAAPGWAQFVSPVTTYQGELLDGGVPANGSYSMRFTLYSASGALLSLAFVDKVVTVTDGRFTALIGDTPLTDGTGLGTYTDLGSIFRDFGNAWVEVRVGATTLTPRQQITSAPYAHNALRTARVDNVFIAGGSTWTVEGLDAMATVAGTNLRFQVGDTSSDALVLFSRMFMLPDGAADQTQSIWFTNGGFQSGEVFRWDDAEDRFEISDTLAVAGPLQVGLAAGLDTEVFSRFGTSAPLSLGMNNIGDVYVADDLEVRSSLIASGNILMRANQPDGDANIYFREGGSDTARVIRWDDSEGRFFMNDDLRLGQTGILELSSVAQGATDGVAEITSVGGVSIRIDDDNDESGVNAGVFAITTQTAGGGVPLLLLEGTDEANLRLDAGVLTNNFDFAEAFRAAPGQESLEPGDVVTLAVGGGMAEHCEIADEGSERLLLGVVSTAPAFLAGMSFDAVEEADPALRAERDAARAAGDELRARAIEEQMDARMRQIWKPIAQIGRVPTKVDGSFGAIKAGDVLTSSPTKGHAMKLTGPGMALGIALEDFDSSGKGTISVFVRPTWHGDPTGAMAQNAAQVEKVALLERENADLKARLDAIEAALSAKMTAR